MNPAGIFIILAGLFAIAGAFFNWDWFMDNRKARVFVKLLGRGGTRIFYMILGAGLAVLGVLIMSGMLEK